MKSRMARGTLSASSHLRCRAFVSRSSRSDTIPTSLPWTNQAATARTSASTAARTARRTSRASSSLANCRRSVRAN